MATTGTAIWPGATTLPGSGTIPGQGTLPFVRCRLSFDDISDSTPSWTEVSQPDLRGFSVTRGRQGGPGPFDAGTATVNIDTRDRAYDFFNTATIRPGNRVWLYEEFTGEIQDLFVGYVDSWSLDWPNGGWSDAVATAQCSDEFKVLTVGALPTTDPPRQTYSDLALSDQPVAQYSFNEDPSERARIPYPEEPAWVLGDIRTGGMIEMNHPPRPRYRRRIFPTGR